MNTKPYEYLRANRIRIKKKLVEIKGGRCCLCGYCKSMQALEFHHRNPRTKLFKLSGINLTRHPWFELIRELEKCDILCSNCHAEIEQPVTNKIAEKGSNSKS